MKKQKYFILFSILALAGILFSSCGGGASGGAIFKAIEGEVKLGKKTASWAITSMAYYNGNLYITNGHTIFTKGKGAGRGWSTVSTQYDGAIGLLASDDNNLYVLTYKPSTEVTSTNQDSYNYSDVQVAVLYGPSTGTISSLKNVMTIFDNKSYNGGREAFATVYSGNSDVGGTTYKLNGTAAPTSKGSNAASAVKVGGSSSLFSSFISTSDYDNQRAWYVELTGNGSSFNKSNTGKFTITGVNGGRTINLEQTSGDGPLSEKKHGKITGLAYYEETVSGEHKEFLLVSTTKGYYRVALDDTKVVKANPHANGEQLAGMGIIEGAFWTLPTGAIYAGVTTADKNRYGLWAYYPNDAWNVD